MTTVKAAVIYYSATGTIHQMAERIATTAEAAGAEVRLRHVAEIAPSEAIATNDQWTAHRSDASDLPTATPDDITWADLVFLGSPTRYGNVASQLQAFIDTLGPKWMAGELADKVYSAFTSSQTMHGGQEGTITALYREVAHWGGIIVPPGYTDALKFADGNPYGVSHATGATNDAPLTDEVVAALDHMAKRSVDVAARLAA